MSVRKYEWTQHIVNPKNVQRMHDCMHDVCVLVCVCVWEGGGGGGGLVSVFDLYVQPSPVLYSCCLLLRDSESCD